MKTNKKKEYEKIHLYLNAIQPEICALSQYSRAAFRNAKRCTHELCYIYTDLTRTSPSTTMIGTYKNTHIKYNGSLTQRYALYASRSCHSNIIKISIYRYIIYKIYITRTSIHLSHKNCLCTKICVYSYESIVYMFKYLYKGQTPHQYQLNHRILPYVQHKCIYVKAHLASRRMPTGRTCCTCP